jgi:hypothetical protein
VKDRRLVFFIFFLHSIAFLALFGLLQGEAKKEQL